MRHQRRKVFIHITLASIAFVLLTTKSHANGISAVMGWTAIHLWFGNALIGLVEGMLIGWIFKVSKVKSVGVMILANYFSMGITLLCGINFKIDLYNALQWAYIVPVLCYVSTVILECPFCLLVLWRTPGKYPRALMASLLVNTVSYLLLFPIYSSASDHSLYRLTKIDQKVVEQCKLPAMVYFLSPDDSALYQIGINGAGMKRVIRTPLSGQDFVNGLFAQPSSAEDKHWEVWIQIWIKGQGHRNVKLLDLPAGYIATDWNYRYNQSKDDVYNFDPEESAPLLSGGKSHWTARAWRHRWGLYLENREKNYEIKLNFESPFMAFHSSSPTLLQGDVVVYQLADQIALLDLNQMKLGVIAKGIYPIVALDAKQNFHKTLK